MLRNILLTRRGDGLGPLEGADARRRRFPALLARQRVPREAEGVEGRGGAEDRVAFVQMEDLLEFSSVFAAEMK